MARLPRIDIAGLPQHLIQRGNNRQICFGCDEDMAAYAHWLLEYSSKFKVDIHAWVFMTNHVHLLVTPRIKSGEEPKGSDSIEIKNISILVASGTDDLIKSAM